MKSFSRNLKYTFAFVTLLFAIYPSSAFASKIYFETPSQSVSAGDTIVVSVKMDPEGQVLNTVDGTVSVASPNLVGKVSDLSLAHSAFSLWPRKPSLSVDGKSISFVGGVPGGFSSPQTLFEIIVTTTTSGDISFDGKAVLGYLNDGQATLAPMVSQALTVHVHSLPVGEKNLNEWEQALNGDVTPPQAFTITSGHDVSLFDGQTFITFNAVDTDSGIDHYEVREGNMDAVRSGTTYVLQDQHSYETISVSAYDKANNVRTETYRTPFKFSFTFVGIVLLALVIIGFLYKRYGKRKKHH